MAAAKLFHAAGRQVTVPTYLVPATQKARCRRPATHRRHLTHQPIFLAFSDAS